MSGLNSGWGGGLGIFDKEYPFLGDFDKKIFTLDLASASQMQCGDMCGD